jgi:hypothetical protein
VEVGHDWILLNRPLHRDVERRIASSGWGELARFLPLLIKNLAVPFLFPFKRDFEPI